jgi:hypothetical protein
MTTVMQGDRVYRVADTAHRPGVIVQIDPTRVMPVQVDWEHGRGLVRWYRADEIALLEQPAQEGLL